MAATSKQTDSSCFPSSSSSKFWDVFLSFGGKDTRRDFIGHLYSALVRTGIQTFKDEPGLQRGEKIAPQLIEAIHDSKMSIIVFSKNYASSKWCLTELAEILECKRTEGHIVLPVFCDVDPLNVRHQTMSYAEAFEKHEKRYAKELVETWKTALTTSADISGYDLKTDANGHEADLIQKIVNDVLMKLWPKNLNVTDHQVGIDSRVNEICQKLSIGSTDVRFIGIYGMAGIGKTTIVNALYKKIYREFDGSCFLENVREYFEKPRGLHKLIEELIFQVLTIKDFKVPSVDAGKIFVKERLRSKKVLIVLDDLDEIKQLESLAGNWNWFGPGSRIIFTTRDSRLLDEFQVDLRHEVKELDDNESLELFKWHAFRNTTPLKNLMELSKDIVSYVGGLPLALKLLGSCLFKRPMVEWEDVCREMKEIPHKDIQKTLRITYDALDDDKLRNIFLDIACFFIGMDKDDVIRILDACGFSRNIRISILRERCLLTIGWDNKLRMHNLIRDMGRKIVREESDKNPSMRSRLWFHEDAYDVLKNFKGRVHEKIEGIRLVMPMQEEVDICTRAFNSIPNLRLLQISNVNLTGSFEKLFEELRWFCWYYCSLDCLPSSFQARKLVFLDMQHSKVKILWKGTKQLQSLKILNASGSRFLKTTPDFKGLESLEKLVLHSCSSLSRIHPSIGLLNKLVHLNLDRCDSLNQLPEQLGNMVCLRTLYASWSSIEQLPDSIGCLGKLEVLQLQGCKKLRNLPSSICDLTSLTSFDLCNCPNLESLPKNFGNLTSLGFLTLSGCSNLESLPKNFGNLTSLTYLNLSETNIMQLPDSIGCLTRLKNLDTSCCERLWNTPRSIYNLSSLESLSLCDWSVISLPSNLSQLVNLKWLDVSDCSSLQSLPELPPNLLELLAIGCTSLDKLPNLSRMNSLRTLDFTQCSSLQSLPKLPPNLVGVHFSACWSLQFLPELPLSIKYLHLQNCTSLRSLPELPPVLRELFLNNCSSLESLPELPPVLHRMKLNNCSSLESLPELPSDLVTLDLSNCKRLLSLPKLPPNLSHLYLINCTSLRSLPKLPCNLGYLDLSDCSSLESLQERTCRLFFLNASGCNSLQKLSDLSDLTNLCTLILADCSNLISNFILSFLLDCCRLDGCDVYLPSRVIQDWFRHQTMGSSISFQMPVEVKSNFLRMAFGVVFRAKIHTHIEAVITNKTDGTQFKYWDSVETTGVHSYVRFMEKPISMKSGDRIEVSFRLTDFTGISKDGTMEMCGVHFDCKRVRDVDVDVVQPLCSFKRLKTLGIGIFQKLLGGYAEEGDSSA